MPFDREQIKEKAAALAAKGVYVGTSSWKYQGWLNQLYTPSRYEYRGKVATKRFEQNCLSEYAEVFKTVCVDAAYYRFPPVEYLQGLSDQVPDDFRFGFKVTDDITIKRFPNHPRHGDKAGKANADFLNADRFATEQWQSLLASYPSDTLWCQFWCQSPLGNRCESQILRIF